MLKRRLINIRMLMCIRSCTVMYVCVCFCLFIWAKAGKIHACMRARWNNSRVKFLDIWMLVRVRKALFLLSLFLFSRSFYLFLSLSLPFSKFSQHVVSHLYKKIGINRGSYSYSNIRTYMQCIDHMPGVSALATRLVQYFWWGLLRQCGASSENCLSTHGLCMCLRIDACIYVVMYAFTHESVLAWVYLCVYMHACIHTYAHRYGHTFGNMRQAGEWWHDHVYICMNTYKYTYIHKYTYKYIHVCILTYKNQCFLILHVCQMARLTCLK